MTENFDQESVYDDYTTGNDTTAETAPRRVLPIPRSVLWLLAPLLIILSTIGLVFEIILLISLLESAELHLYTGFWSCASSWTLTLNIYMKRYREYGCPTPVIYLCHLVNSAAIVTTTFETLSTFHNSSNVKVLLKIAHIGSIISAVCIFICGFYMNFVVHKYRKKLKKEQQEHQNHRPVSNVYSLNTIQVNFSAENPPQLPSTDERPPLYPDSNDLYTVPHMNRTSETDESSYPESNSLYTVPHMNGTLPRSHDHEERRPSPLLKPITVPDVNFDETEDEQRVTYLSLVAP